MSFEPTPSLKHLMQMSQERSRQLTDERFERLIYRLEQHRKLGVTFPYQPDKYDRPRNT